jgi:hypothetical protein
VLVSVRRRVPDVDADWYLRILAIADLDRKIGAASTILDTVHVPAYTADSPMKMCAAGSQRSCSRWLQNDDSGPVPGRQLYPFDDGAGG